MTAILPPKLDWVEDDVPVAEDLNAEWRDPMRYFLGHDRPLFVGYLSADGAASTPLATSTVVTLPIDTEQVKRGGMAHSNSIDPQRVIVPIGGIYEGIAFVGIGAPGATQVGNRVAAVQHNGGVIARRTQVPPTTSSGAATLGGIPFRRRMLAGDYVTMYAFHTQGTTLFPVDGSSASGACRLAIWWVAR